MSSSSQETVLQTMSLFEIKRRVLKSRKSGEPLHIAVKTDASWEELEKLSDVARSVRLGLDSAKNEAIIKLNPSSAHEIAIAYLTMLFAETFPLTHGQQLSFHIIPTGASDFILSPTRRKQADASFCRVDEAVVPGIKSLVVFGGGTSENYTRLKDDTAWWLESGGVNLVILVLIDKKHPQSLNVELWESQPIQNAQLDNQARQFQAIQRGPRLNYPQPISGAAYNVEALHIPHADFGILDLQGDLVVPMENWATCLWRNM